MLENSPNFNIPLPNKTDEETDVADSLATGLTIIDTELKSRKDELDEHKTSPTAHSSANISHGDGTVEVAFTEISDRMNELDVRVTGTANSAVTTAESVQEQFNRVVAEAGSNNPEVVQARGSEVNLNARLDNLTTSLADIVYNVKSFGAKGDGVKDDSVAIQNAINNCPIGGTVYLPVPASAYKIQSTITINKSIKFIGASMGVVLKHYGVGAAVKITAWDWSLENLHIQGDGIEQLQGDGTYLYGVGASSEYGIELDGSVGGVNRFSLRNVKVTKHFKHGIYCHGGVWIGLFDNCYIFYNGLDGVNANYEGTIQNGNNFTFLGGSYSGNGRHGIQWGAANGTFLNIDSETNNKAGLCLTKGVGANIIGGYFENNHEEQILLDATSGAITWSIKGAYINSAYANTGAGNSLIKAIGTNPITQSIEDITWSKTGASVLYFADFNNLPSYGSLLRFTENAGAITSVFINLGKMKIVTSPKDIMISGRFLSKGQIPFSANIYSDDFRALGTTSTDFMIPIEEQTIILSLLLSILTDSTTAVTTNITLTVIKNDGTTVQYTESAITNGTATIAKTFTNPIRIDSARGAILTLSFSRPSIDGTYLRIGNPVIQVA